MIPLYRVNRGYPQYELVNSKSQNGNLETSSSEPEAFPKRKNDRSLHPTQSSGLCCRLRNDEGNRTVRDRVYKRSDQAEVPQACSAKPDRRHGSTPEQGTSALARGQ